MNEEKTVKAEKQHSGFYNFITTLWRTKKVAFFGLVVLILFILVAIFADVLAPQKMVDGLLKSSLLEAALDNEETELAVRIGYWRSGDRERVAEIVDQLRQERELADTPPWGVYYYPAEEPVGLIEFVLEGAELTEEDSVAETPEAPEENFENIETNS